MSQPNREQTHALEIDLSSAALVVAAAIASLFAGYVMAQSRSRRDQKDQ